MPYGINLKVLTILYFCDIIITEMKKLTSPLGSPKKKTRRAATLRVFLFPYNRCDESSLLLNRCCGFHKSFSALKIFPIIQKLKSSYNLLAV